MRFIPQKLKQWKKSSNYMESDIIGLYIDFFSKIFKTIKEADFPT